MLAGLWDVGMLSEVPLTVPAEAGLGYCSAWTEQLGVWRENTTLPRAPLSGCYRLTFAFPVCYRCPL